MRRFNPVAVGLFATFLVVMGVSSSGALTDAVTANAGWVEMGSGSASGGGISNNDSASVDASLAIGPDGPIVAWGDNSTEDSEIFVRRWNGTAWVEMGSGSASGGGISNNAGNSVGPSLAIGPEGPMVTWTDLSNGNREIYVRRWNGTSWVEMGSGSASGGGISNSAGASGSPSLAIGPDGPVVAWADDSGSNQEIYVRRWNGTAWVEMGSGSASGVGISNSAGDSFTPSLAIGPDGPVVAWRDSSGDFEIYIRRWNGTAWVEMGSGSASGGGISNNSGNSYGPSLAIGPDGPVVAWHDSSGGNWEIYVRRWDGTTWVEMSSGSASGGGISNNDGTSSYPSLAVGPDGLVVAWADDFVNYSGTHREIYVRRWDGTAWVTVGNESASTWGISVNNGNSEFPSLAIGPDGPVVAWEDERDGDYEIYVRRRDFPTWVEMGRDSASNGGISNNNGDSANSSVAIGPDGPVIAWSDGPIGGASEIYVRRWNGTAWVEMGSGSASGGGISNNTGDSTVPSLAIGPDGPVIAWRDGPNGGAGEIYVRRWNGTAWVEMGSGSASGGGITNNIGDSSYPSLAIGPDGPVVAWEDDSGGDYEIYVRRWNGTAWVEMGSGSAFSGGISNNADDSLSPSLAIGLDGSFIAWTDRSGGPQQIYVRRWNGTSWVEMGSGSASGEGISNEANASSNPSLAIGPDGPVVAWNASGDGGREIWVRSWDGTSWVEMGSSSASGGGISNSEDDSLLPSLAIGPDGPIIAWSDRSDGIYEIYVRRWNGTAWVEMGSGSASGGGISDYGYGGSFLVSLAIGPDGPIVSWSFDRVFQFDVYAPMEILVLRYHQVACSSSGDPMTLPICAFQPVVVGSPND